jgi:hypothetical protein
MCGAARAQLAVLSIKKHPSSGNMSNCHTVQCMCGNSQMHSCSSSCKQAWQDAPWWTTGAHDVSNDFHALTGKGSSFATLTTALPSLAPPIICNTAQHSTAQHTHRLHFRRRHMLRLGFNGISGNDILFANCNAALVPQFNC